MVNCENPDSISSSWDTISDFSNPKPVGKINISPELKSKLNNLLGSKASSINPVAQQSNIPILPPPPPPPPLSLNSITNQQPSRRNSLEDDRLTSISNVSSSRKRKVVIKKQRRLSLGNDPLPQPSRELIDIGSQKYDVKLSFDRRSFQYIGAGASFIIGYLFCFYFGKSC